eukprot:4757723-Pyramimonas_sp.AAC.1
MPPFSLDLVERLRLCELPNPEELQHMPQGHIIQIPIVLDMLRAWQGFRWAFGSVFLRSATYVIQQSTGQDAASHCAHIAS